MYLIVKRDEYLSQLEIHNYKLINFASIEMAKACIFYASGRINLCKNDIISSGVNFYYSVFHNCVSIVALSPRGKFLEEGVIDWKDRFNAPKWYIPCSHERLITETKIIDQEFAQILAELKDIREYLSYGPYVCSDHTPHWKPIINTCEIKDIKQKLESYNSNLCKIFSKTPEIVNGYLQEGTPRLVFCLWGDDAIKIFRGELIFSKLLYNEGKKIWLYIRKGICPRTRSPNK